MDFKKLTLMLSMSFLSTYSVDRFERCCDELRGKLPALIVDGRVVQGGIALFYSTGEYCVLPSYCDDLKRLNSADFEKAQKKVAFEMVQREARLAHEKAAADRKRAEEFAATHAAWVANHHRQEEVFCVSDYRKNCNGAMGIVECEEVPYNAKCFKLPKYE